LWRWRIAQAFAVVLAELEGWVGLVAGVASWVASDTAGSTEVGVVEVVGIVRFVEIVGDVG